VGGLKNCRIPQLREDATIQIRLEVESASLARVEGNFNTKVWQWRDRNGVRVHGKPSHPA
jgi:hypothetical protein